jgi:hypothetical protein
MCLPVIARLDRAIQMKKMDTPVKPEYDRQESTFSEVQHVCDNFASKACLSKHLQEIIKNIIATVK